MKRIIALYSYTAVPYAQMHITSRNIGRVDTDIVSARVNILGNSYSPGIDAVGHGFGTTTTTRPQGRIVTQIDVVSHFISCLISVSFYADYRFVIVVLSSDVDHGGCGGPDLTENM